MIWLVAGALALFLAEGGAKWLFGQGPFDGKPSGTSNDVIGINDVKASSGSTYKVTSFKRYTQIYFVAVKKDSLDWISYLFSPQTKAKVWYKANAGSDEGVAAMKKDFEL
jgi:hypothetical protein